MIARYFFDRELRSILFGAIESIEVTLRTKMINCLSQKYGGYYYQDRAYFGNNERHKRCLERLENEFLRSNEVFAQKFKCEYGVDECGRLREYPPAWLIFEVATFGMLSMMYKNLAHQLPEKLLIAHDFGFNNQREFFGVLELVSYVRNVVAHHSGIWARDVVKPLPLIKSQRHMWLRSQPDLIRRKPFIAITVVLYLCNAISMRNTVGAADAGESYKKRIIALVEKKERLAIQGWGFPVDWRSEPIWGGNE